MNVGKVSLARSVIGTGTKGSEEGGKREKKKEKEKEKEDFVVQVGGGERGE